MPRAIKMNSEIPAPVPFGYNFIALDSVLNEFRMFTMSCKSSKLKPFELSLFGKGV
jgi:hypothetical protein